MTDDASGVTAFDGAAEAASSVVASMSAFMSTKTKPRPSPVTAAWALATASPVARALEPFVSTAALTDARSPTSATLPPTIANAAWTSGILGAANTVSSVPLYVSGAGHAACLQCRGQPRARECRVLDRQEQQRHGARALLASPPPSADRPGREADLAAEPRLDVLGVGLLAVAALGHEAIEDLVELGLERRLVGEARELREELADLLALVAGQVESQLAVGDAVRRDVAEDGRRRPRARERERRKAGDGDDDGDQHARGEPAHPAAARGRARRRWLAGWRVVGTGVARSSPSSVVGAVEVGHRVVSPGVSAGPPSGCRARRADRLRKAAS